jgi:hypothetical protein
MYFGALVGEYYFILFTCCSHGVPEGISIVRIFNVIIVTASKTRSADSA